MTNTKRRAAPPLRRPAGVRCAAGARRQKRSRARRPAGGAGWRPLLLLLLLLTAGCGLFGPRDGGGSRGSRGNSGGGDESDAPAYLPAYSIQLPDYVEPDLLPVNKYSRPGTYLTEINGVVIHYVGNPGSTARGNRNYFANLSDGREGRYASSHFIVGLDGEVLQCVPLTEIAYCSNHRNSDTISIEVCHPDEGGQFSDVTYNRVVELTAWLCDTFGLDPAREVIRHYDVSGKECPRYYVRHPEAWEQFKTDAAALLPWADGAAQT